MRAELITVPVLPHSIDAEQAVLGSILLDSANAWPHVEGKLSAADFYRPDHRVIFEAIETIIRGGGAAEYVAVIAQLERRGQLDAAGGQAAIVRLAKDTPTAANIEQWVAGVRERSTLRQILTICERGRGGVFGRVTAAEVLADMQARLTDLQAKSRTGKGLITAEQLARELIDDLDARRESPRGLALGLADFDELTSGLEGGDLVVIAGRPGMGKTSILVTIGVNVSIAGTVAIFSAEMPARQLMRRAVALRGEISQQAFRRPDLLAPQQWDAIMRGCADIAERRLYIDDTARPRLEHIRAECAALRAKKGLSLVLIDYVQLVEGHGASRYEQLREVAYGCKALAKDLAVPVVVLAQLNRSVESRDYRDKRPHLSDLRDSGAIEEAADIVGLLYSEGYYNPKFGMEYVLECKVAKNRNGERGRCLWHFDGARSCVKVLDSSAAVEYRRLLDQQSKPQQRASSNDF